MISSFNDPKEKKKLLELSPLPTMLLFPTYVCVVGNGVYFLSYQTL